MTGMVVMRKASVCGGRVRRSSRSCDDDEEEKQVSLVALLVSAIKKSMASCSVEQDQQLTSSSPLHHMEIGWPTNVQHLSHVTFDRFHGFLGLPLELQLQIPSRVPSASVNVFGVSAISMQCSYDTRGNSVPTILLLMQERLYTQKGLQAEGIFRINPENSKEETVRDQLNRGIVPRDIDLHCLAGLIKAWFRELPSGVLDGLSPEEVLHCNTEEKAVELVRQLQPTNTALLNWAIDLMADVVEQEAYNKMNARNIAMVFAPNMTQMSDPLTALMHAVQVMNLLKALIIKTLRERKETNSRRCSPMSCLSSNAHTDEKAISQHGMNTRCELQRLKPVDNKQADYSPTSESEVESPSEIEESFSKHIDVIKTTQNSFREFDRPLNIATSKISSTLIAASGISEFDRRIIISYGLSTSDQEDFGLT